MNRKEILITQGLHKKFSGRQQPAVENLDLQLTSGEIYALVGESGCGKTTALRMIAGLLTPDKGNIRIRDREVYSASSMVPCEQRKVGMVFQNAALFPHLSLEKNVMFGLKGPGRAQRARARLFLEQVGLAELRKAYPHELSGGQQQRVALARALTLEPDLILLDEPFSNLDIRIKTKVIEQVRTILTQVDTTALLVTHDINEAYHLADRIGVMRAGSLIQQGEPSELYHSPADSYVADFLGTANEFELEELLAIFPSLPAQPHGAVETPEAGAQVILRPEDIEIVHLLQAKPTSDDSAEGRIEGVTFLGSRREYSVKVGSLKMRVSTPSHYEIPKGSWVKLTLKPEVHQHLLQRVV